MERESNTGELCLVITTEQIRCAPREVRQWFYRLIGAEAPEGRIVEHNGFRATEDNLAILEEPEARALIARLEHDPIATEVLVQFADDCWDPQSGTHHAHRVSVADILRRTAVASPIEVRRHLDRIESALREGRGDRAVLLFQGNAHLGYSVHPLTQGVLHRLHAEPMLSLVPPAPRGLPAPLAADAAD